MTDTDRCPLRRGSKRPGSSLTLVRKKSHEMTAWVSSSFDAADPPAPPAPPQSTVQSVKKQKSELQTKTIDSTAAVSSGDLLAEKWRPLSRSELCVHVKKVAEVAAWLRTALSPGHRRPDDLLLLLTGPPGAGKTATVRSLAAELGARLCEWNGAPLGGCELPKLEQFLFRADRYETGSRLLLLEDLPPAIIDDPTLLRRLLERHRATGCSPLVLVLSESQHRAISPARLLPRATQDALRLAVIRFNPVAPTQLTKALQRVVRGEAKRGAKAAGGPDLAQIVTECGGDIRCALNQLQFLLSKAPKRKGEEAGGREHSMSIFRALGKVLHCKRLPASAQISSHGDRPPLAFEPEAVVEASCLPGPLFAAFLHENSPDFFASIDEFSEAADAFALSDCLSACWQEGRPAGHQLGDLYAGPLAARGLAFAKRQPKSVGFRPLRRPELLSLAWSGAGRRPRTELLELEPFRRAIARGGRQLGLASHSRSRFSRPLTEHDSAFEDPAFRPPAPKLPREAEEEEMWTIPEENEDGAAIEEWD